MDFNSTVDLIIRDLNEAREIIDDLKNYPGVPAIQVELAKSKCKNASEVIALLKTIKPEPTPDRAVKPEVREKTDDLKKAPGTEIIKPAEAVRENKAPVKKPEKKEPEIFAVEEPVIVQQEKKDINSTIIADRYSNLSTSLNEQLGGSREDGEIGVNDKFLFIREIFNGSPEAYEQALSALESAGGFSEAKEIILGREGIQKDSEAVKQFLNLVKRKFPSDE